MVGAIDGINLKADGDTAWARIEDSVGRVHQIVVAADGQTAVYRTDEGVFQASLGLVG